MTVRLEYDGGFAHLTLSRPQVLNALSFELLAELSRALAGVAESDARALIVTGEGDKAFCAGADIPELMNRPLMQELEGAAKGQAVFSRIAELKIPSVAVIQGYAFGGGLELALACTFRVATDRARMGLPEVKLGLIPGYGGTQRLPRLIGEGRALDLIMSGRTIDGGEAERIGLVNRIDNEGTPLEIGKRFLEPYLKHSLCALYFAREAVQRGGGVAIADGLRIERDLSTLAYRSQDAAEGLRAFVEKRPASFKDC
ncbi:MULTISPECIES: enoyl-CoA hydratase/isomerase family protein [Alcaligenaceae]|uniref:Enoyl-CoA dehydratase n=1 Tax=Bordetella petrii (strain ATCC BAA-461 / DSM 12804 / CCUG 43448 / CIP 107267 / Se-1111R) TaxID=340100 RepID=A9ICJ3_BORPD|nr:MULTISPECIES: enoyl-CoA hydratase-related protein [Alcaligenaceae]CAP41574.1 enoyl-CoA dehydratase [Bordetella petrii]CUJ31457.1 Probable enoyl-CoA hydratase echA8 [Achromobacter xylosoxidans]CUJ71529.1 Probable enoyl-CoA hydratase echA8 [Achromobacter xylosoxidans]